MDDPIVFHEFTDSLSEQFSTDIDDFFSRPSTGIFGDPLAPPEDPRDDADRVHARLRGRRSRSSGVFTEALREDAPRFLHEIHSGGTGAAPLVLSEAHLRLADYCCPSDIDEDVNVHADTTKLTLGLSRSQTRSYIRIGIMLRRLPRIADVLRSRAHLPLEYLQGMSRCVETLGDEFLSDFEFAVLGLITPSADGEVLTGFRSFHTRVQHLVAILDPPVRPKDLEPQCVGDLPRETVVCESDHHTSYLTAVLDKARATEFTAALEAIAEDKKCSVPDALTFLVHGTAQVKVVLNLYLPAFGGGPGYLTQTGVLDDIATERFLSQVSSMRVVGDSTVNSYSPSDAQRAFVMGRDGTCRFPGCEVTADRCEIDHIREYDHDDPGAGGATDTENLHCLCRTHHRMKTAGFFGVARHSDGREVYRSVKGGPEASSMPAGPAARLGRVTVAQHLQRAVSALRTHNERRELFARESTEAVTADAVRREMAAAVETVVEAAKRAGRTAGTRVTVEDLVGEPQDTDGTYGEAIRDEDVRGRMMCDPVFAAQQAAVEAAYEVLDRYSQMRFAEQMAEFEEHERQEREFYGQAVACGEFDAVFEPGEDEELIPF